MRHQFLYVALFVSVVIVVEGTKQCNNYRDCKKCSISLLDRYCESNECTCVINQGKPCTREEDCKLCPSTFTRDCSNGHHCVCRPKPKVDINYCKKWYNCERCPRHHFRTCVNNECICEQLQ